MLWRHRPLKHKEALICSHQLPKTNSLCRFCLRDQSPIRAASLLPAPPFPPSAGTSEYTLRFLRKGKTSPGGVTKLVFKTDSFITRQISTPFLSAYMTEPTNQQSFSGTASLWRNHWKKVSYACGASPINLA